MSKVEVSDSDELKIRRNNSEENEIGEFYGDKGYSKIPLDQINLNTEPISIMNDFSHSFFDFNFNIKSYVKVFLGFAVFIIILFAISILSGHFHYHKDDDTNNEIKDLKKNKMPLKEDISKIPIQSNNRTINADVNITNKNNSINDNFKKENIV